MAKKQSFADKASKKKHVSVCPVCNTEITHIKLMKATKVNSNWRFNNKPVAVCKCNEAEIYG
jgi:uncharacterized protein with PIN domain